MNRGGRIVGWVAAGLVAALLGAGAVVHFLSTPGPPPDADPSPPLSPEVEQQVRDFCSHCHVYPQPSSFPRWAWKHEVEQGYRFFDDSALSLQPPPQAAAFKYFQDRAPEKLPAVKIDYAATPFPAALAKDAWPRLDQIASPHVSNVSLVHLSDPRRLDVLACDMRASLVMSLRPYDTKPAWRVLGEVAHPAHVEVVDLDDDGVKDLLVASLGSFPPTDRRCGSVSWLRGKEDGTFHPPVTLLKDVGRVADVRAANFRGTGKLDLVVASFGWLKTGAILLLENHTTNWAKPDFRPVVLDPRNGTIHVPVADLNGDGKPDFVALFSQEHETVVAFLNEGGGKFRKEPIWSAPDPGYGSSGIELVDINGDGKLDVLYTNGDTLDKPYLLKPYHGVQWLENRGTYPFTHHAIAPMYGVHRAVAADLTGSGRLDILAVSFLPAEGFPDRQKQKLDAVIVLEQTESGKFVRHSLAAGDCDHVSCAVGDVSGTGRKDLVLGSYGAPSGTPPVVFWRNRVR